MQINNKMTNNPIKMDERLARMVSKLRLTGQKWRAACFRNSSQTKNGFSIFEVKFSTLMRQM